MSNAEQPKRVSNDELLMDAYDRGWNAGIDRAIGELTKDQDERWKVVTERLRALPRKMPRTETASQITGCLPIGDGATGLHPAPVGEPIVLGREKARDAEPIRELLRICDETDGVPVRESARPELQPLKNQIEHYKGLWDCVCGQIAEMCLLAGVDKDDVLDAWTLHAAIKRLVEQRTEPAPNDVGESQCRQGVQTAAAGVQLPGSPSISSADNSCADHETSGTGVGPARNRKAAIDQPSDPPVTTTTPARGPEEAGPERDPCDELTAEAQRLGMYESPKVVSIGALLAEADRREQRKAVAVTPDGGADLRAIESAFIKAYAFFVRLGWSDLSEEEVDPQRDACIAQFDAVKRMFGARRVFASPSPAKEKA